MHRLILFFDFDEKTPCSFARDRVYSMCIRSARMAELADALVSGTSEDSFMQVQVLFLAPYPYNPNQFFPVGDGFGLFVYFERYENTYFPNGVIKRPESKPRGPRKKKSTK